MGNGVWSMDNRLYFGVRSVEREARRQRRRLVGGAHTLSCKMQAVWQGEEHTHLLLALTRFVWACSAWQLQRRGQCPAASDKKRCCSVYLRTYLSSLGLSGTCSLVQHVPYPRAGTLTALSYRREALVPGRHQKLFSVSLS